MLDANHSAPGDIVIRRATTADLPAILKIAASSETSAHWTAAVYSAYCVPHSGSGEMQAKAMFIAVDGHGHAMGLAVLAAVPGTGDSELENMVVDESVRRRGVGRRLLRAGLLWCRGWRAAVADAPTPGLWLEVRASNVQAIAFYLAAGFIMTGSRAEYYSRPVEDAVLMRKGLSP